MVAGSSVSGGSEEELETTLRKWNLLTNPQGELLKTEVLSKDVLEASSMCMICLHWFLCGS